MRLYSDQSESARTSLFLQYKRTGAWDEARVRPRAKCSTAENLGALYRYFQFFAKKVGFHVLAGIPG